MELSLETAGVVLFCFVLGFVVRAWLARVLD